MATTKGAHDLLVVLDGTGSMGNFVQALNKSLPEILSLSALTGCFERIGIVVYRDYCGGNLVDWSGWCSPSGAVTGDDIISQELVLKMASDIVADWGGDWPEATKTGLAKAYEEMREDATTIVLLYTDAPPHFKATSSDGPNYTKEKQKLSKEDSFSGFGPRFVDWVSAAHTFKNGPKRGVVFSILSHAYVSSYTPYLYLSTITGGASFSIDIVTPNIISQLTMGVLLTWMGAGKAVEGDDTKVGNIKEYRKAEDLEKVKSEIDPILNKYLATGHIGANHNLVGHNVGNRTLSLKDMPTVLKTRGPSVKNFAKRYVNDQAYKQLAVDQLRRIISANVSAVSVNPIFGTLWRTVCNDRANEARDGLLADFSRQIERIEDATEKARMKAWLEESYNYKAEIQAEIAKVPEEDRFPIVFLDPTAKFGTVADEEEDGDDNRPINKFTRGELLEIGRSCDYRILRRLGKVLTRLSYVEKAEDMPAHIKSAKAHKVPQIPMALAKPKYKRQFWKILLHAVLPGTMVTARPAAVLAALALRMGIVPLRDVADQELMSFHDRWNTIDIPETWNVGCLGLLLDADRDFERRVTEGITKRPTPESVILKAEDRRLFSTLVDYKLLEFNLKTTLQAKIGWTPEKSKAALGPVVVCRECKFPRSVTIMSANGICGICTRFCSCTVCTRSDDHEIRAKTNVSVGDTEKSMGYWVECGRVQCRAQYVVYNPSALNVRPKCFYCRHDEGKSNHGPAPVVECTKCLNRVIWPKEYRPKNTDLSKFECYGCASNVVTIISQDTTAESLTKENGSKWLLRNDGDAIAAAFNGRSLFYTASQCDLANLPDKVEILPAEFESALTITGKLVRNQPELKAALGDWVGSRRTESGVCSLCFSNVRKADLRRACGRNGCHQLICNGCIKDWYGLNARGRIINIAALSCAFCRRRPTPKTIGPFGLAGVGDLRKAVEKAGSWVYAWCNSCGFAKPYVERACAAGAPAELTDWNCAECTLSDSKVVVTKACPGCTAETMKVAGCDHITCLCGTHWCFECGKNTGPEGIYPHIAEEHNGNYNIWDADDDDEGGWAHDD